MFLLVAMATSSPGVFCGAAVGVSAGAGPGDIPATSGQLSLPQGLVMGLSQLISLREKYEAKIQDHGASICLKWHLVKQRYGDGCSISFLLMTLMLVFPVLGRVQNPRILGGLCWSVQRWTGVQTWLTRLPGLDQTCWTAKENKPRELVFLARMY